MNLRDPTFKGAWTRTIPSVSANAIRKADGINFALHSPACHAMYNHYYSKYPDHA